MGLPGPRGAAGHQGPPVCFENTLCNSGIDKKLMFIYLILSLLHMWFLFGFLLKGEPGDQGERGLKGERGSEVSWNYLRQLETYCWFEKAQTFVI